MKYLISYFYQLRFFKRNFIPFSTAIWDPKWFHDFTNDQNYTFKDKHGVYNGIRAEMLHPEKDNTECLNCQSEKDPTKCSFIQKYKEQLNKLNFNELKEYLEDTALSIQKYENFKEEPVIVLLVYETPDNKCSERVPLQEYFKKHGVDLPEFRKEDI